MDDANTVPELVLRTDDAGMTLSDAGQKLGLVPPLRMTMQPGGTSLVIRRIDTIIGRHSRSDVILPSLDVSRRHCRISYGGDVWWVIDLDSTNGTFVNDENISRCALRAGDRLRVGGYDFCVEGAGLRAAG